MTYFYFSSSQNNLYIFIFSGNNLILKVTYNYINIDEKF